MKSKILVFALLSVLGAASLLLAASPNTKPIKLRGLWVRDSSANSMVYFHRAQAFEEGSAGMQFKGGGKMDIHRTPSNCGVDAQYFTVPGTWKMATDRKFTIAYRDPQGNVEEDLEVLSLKDNLLVLSYLDRRVDNNMKPETPVRVK